MKNDNNPIRVLISDDQPIFRFGLRSLLESQSDIAVVGEGSVGLETVALTNKLRPDILLLDLAPPEAAGLQVLSHLARLPLRTRTLVMTCDTSKAGVVQALHLGASGVVVKNSPREVMLESLRSVAAGQYWLSRESVPIVIEALHTRVPDQGLPVSTGKQTLTAQELKLISKISSGLSNREIGHAFEICERTVKHRLTHIFQKLGVSTRLELVLFALEHRLLDYPSAERKLRRFSSSKTISL